MRSQLLPNEFKSKTTVILSSDEELFGVDRESNRRTDQYVDPDRPEEPGDTNAGCATSR